MRPAKRIHLSLSLIYAVALGAQAQSGGSLTPPAGPPAPTMKRLDEIESRVAISTLPYSITSSGSYYVTKNLTGPADLDGITIDADDVTLDLNGFTLRQETGGTSGDGIFVLAPEGELRRNVYVYNGVLRGWGDDGLNAGSAAGSRFERIRSFNNQSDGIVTGRDCAVIDCSAAENSQDGIDVDFGGVVRDCTTFGNGDNGIQTEAGTIVVNCTASNNSGDGINTTSGCIVEKCTATGNDQYGFNIGNANKVSGCTATSNGDGTNDPLDPADTSGTGFLLGVASIIENCTSRLNDGHGVSASSDSIVLNNQCDENGRCGVRTEKANVRIEGNHCTDNGEWGVCALGTGGSLIIKNSATGNIMGSFEIAAGHKVGPIVTDPATATNPFSNLDF